MKVGLVCIQQKKNPIGINVIKLVGTILKFILIDKIHTIWKKIRIIPVISRSVIKSTAANNE